MLFPRMLILYGTTDGHTRKIASALAETARSMEWDADVVNAASQLDPTPADYEAVIVAAPVRGGRYLRSVRRWVKAHAVQLNDRPTAFVSVSLSVLERSAKSEAALSAIVENLVAETGWRPPTTRFVAGALLYTRYNWFIRWIMKRIVARAHGDTDTSRDYEYTDWNALRTFACEFARRQSPHASGRLNQAS